MEETVSTQLPAVCVLFHQVGRGGGVEETVSAQLPALCVLFHQVSHS